MTVVFPDRTVATLSYPRKLRLAEMGAQTTISYTFDDPRYGAPHDIIFVPGELPTGLLGEPVETFAGAQATLHPVAVKGSALRGGLRGDPPYALVVRGADWLFVATLRRLDDAQVVANNLHFSVTRSGWPSVVTTGPLELSEGFGEARGPHIHLNDGDPTFDTHTDDRYIIMGLIPGCGKPEDEISDSYASKCLSFEGDELGIAVSIYGSKGFVRSVHEGLELER